MHISPFGQPQRSQLASGLVHGTSLVHSKPAIEAKLLHSGLQTDSLPIGSQSASSGQSVSVEQLCVQNPGVERQLSGSTHPSPIVQDCPSSPGGRPLPPAPPPDPAPAPSCPSEPEQAAPRMIRAAVAASTEKREDPSMPQRTTRGAGCGGSALRAGLERNGRAGERLRYRAALPGVLGDGLELRVVTRNARGAV
jgi:hypothetical protein